MCQGTNPSCTMSVQAEMQLSLQQKREALGRREVYWFEMGRVLWRREQLLEKLQVAAVRLEEEAEGELEMWIMLPRPASLEVRLPCLSNRFSCSFWTIHCMQVAVFNCTS